jgi:hypothetical protein
MLDDLKKKKILSDRALERVMRDVMCGLMDVSLELGNECLETPSAEVTLSSQNTFEEAVKTTKEIDKS